MSIGLSMAILDLQIVASSLPDVAGGGSGFEPLVPLATEILIELARGDY